MNETAKTGVIVAFGALFLVVGVVARPAAPERSAYDDSGERFFPEFAPTDARSLEIVAFDADTAQVKAFKVAEANGVWSIPSHEGYPADAADHLAEAAASVMDVVKGPSISELAGAHEMYGVLDPKADRPGTTGVGTRVTMTDAKGDALADIIIGEKVKDSPDLRYVRDPLRDRVYTAKVSTEKLTTKFHDWIEEDLLELNANDIREIVVNDYSIDEFSRSIVQRGLIELGYDQTDSTWTLKDLAEGEKLDFQTCNEMRSALDDLQIINVFRKPAGLSAELRGDDALQLDQQAIGSLQNAGYMLVQGQLLSNQGETMVRMANGVVYAMRFGEIVAGETGEGILDEEQGSGEETEPSASEEGKGGEGSARYLFVLARLDESLIPEPEYKPLPDAPAPVEGAEETEEAKAAGSLAAAEREEIEGENDRLRTEHEKKLDDARKLVGKLNDRFADWYYVISNDVYERVRISREDIVTTDEPAEAPAADGAAPDTIELGPLPPEG